MLALSEPMTAQAQQPLSFIDQIASPLTDAELGAAGCLTASVATGGVLLYLMGGFSRIAASMQGVMPPLRVMEGAAAVSFIFSSVCYVGSALAPMAMKAYTSITDSDFPSFSEYESMLMGGKPATTNGVTEKTSP